MRYYGQFNPHVDEILHKRYFPDKRGGFFVECGAYDGMGDSSCRFFEEFMDWKGLNIEASPRIFALLQKNRPASTNVNLALSNQNGTASFFDVVSPNGEKSGNGSLIHTAMQKDMIIGLNQGWRFSPVEIKTIVYRDLMANMGIKDVDLLVLDVEGHELQAIEGMKNGPVPLVMCVEYSFSGQEPISSALAKMGMKLDFCQDVNMFFSRR